MASSAAPIWNSAKEALDDQLSALQLEMQRFGNDVLDRIADEMANGLNHYRTGLVAALLDYDRATPETRGQMSMNALKVIEEYRGRLSTDRNVLSADDNPFGLSLNIAQALSGALDELSAELTA